MTLPNFERIHEEAVLQVHNRSYVLNIEAQLPNMLHLTLSPPSNSNTAEPSSYWKSSFTAEYIEQVTQKTGNFKKFAVFVEMLITALKNSDESGQESTVSLDLLTQSEIDQMRSPSGSFSQNNSFGRNGLDGEEKVYLLLIYSVAFDRVLYPLVLKRQRLGHVRRNSNNVPGIPQSPSTQSLASDFNQPNNGISKRERDILLENLRLKREIETLVGERTSVERAFNQLRSETASQFESIKHELYQLNEHTGITSDEKQLVSQQMDKCYALIEQLLDELKQTQLENQQIKFDRDTAVNAMKRELQQVKNELLTRSTVSSRQRSLSASSARSNSSQKYATTPSRYTTTNNNNRLKKTASVESLSSTLKNQNTRGRSPSLRQPRQPVQQQQAKRDSSVSSTRSTGSNSSFKRFDPTAYVKERQQKLHHRQSLINTTPHLQPKTKSNNFKDTSSSANELKERMESKSVDERLHLLTSYFKQLKQTR